MSDLANLSAWRQAALSLVFLCALLSSPIATVELAANVPQPQERQAHPNHATEQQQPPPEVARTPEMLRGKPFSEFNHRMAGVFLLVGGLFFLWKTVSPPRWRWIQYTFPFCLVLPGFYLLFLSDPKWPFGPGSFWHYFTTNTQFMQHKVYSILLMVMGTIEFLRVRQVLTGTWSAFAFPVLAAFGAVLLLFHPHAPGHDMNAMEFVESQHLGFALVGGVVAATKALSEVSWRGRGFCEKLWPGAVCILGVLLLFYRE